MFTRETNVQLSSHLVVLGSLWNSGLCEIWTVPALGGFACTRLKHLSDAQTSQCCFAGQTVDSFVCVCVCVCVREREERVADPKGAHASFLKSIQDQDTLIEQSVKYSNRTVITQNA